MRRGTGCALDELVRWQTDQGPVLVEVDAREPGFQSVSRPDHGFAFDAAQRLESALGHVRGAAESALRALRDGRLDPDMIELEFGVKLNASAGAVIAKTAGEAHLKVKLTWGGPAGPANAEPDQGNDGAGASGGDAGSAGSGASGGSGNDGDSGSGRSPNEEEG
ncbi:CU044_2847 family protein [Actinomadura fulvescens]